MNNLGMLLQDQATELREKVDEAIEKRANGGGANAPAAAAPAGAPATAAPAAASGGGGGGGGGGGASDMATRTLEKEMEAKLEEATALLREALEGRRALLGDSNADTLDSIYNLGVEL